MSHQRNEYLSLMPSHLTAVTQAALDRAIRRALAGVKGTAVPLRRVITTAMGELTATRMDAAGALRHLDAMVENAGRGGAGDRMSLMSGKPRWMAVRDQVLAEARATLGPASTI
jgi:hypothetical protein